MKQVADLYGEKRPQFDASAIAATNIEKREYQKEYLEYWNSTAELTGTGRPVDAFISPLAPFCAARPEKYKYYGYSTIINMIDYTSCVLPITTVDKSVDVVDETFSPLSDFDKDISNDCECHPVRHRGLNLTMYRRSRDLRRSARCTSGHWAQAARGENLGDCR